MRKQVVCIKMKDSSVYAGLYYIGALLCEDADQISLENPLRFIETLQQKKVPSSVVGITGQAGEQILTEPILQDFAEVALSPVVVIPTSSIMLTSPVEEDGVLLKVYNESLKRAIEFKKAARVTESKPAMIEN